MKLRLKKLKESGQTMIEYLLLILVLVAIMQSVFTKLNEYIITNPDSLQNRYLKGYENVFSAGEGGVKGRYKRFRILR